MPAGYALRRFEVTVRVLAVGLPVQVVLDDDCNAVDGCEFATELTCDDQYDNDADGNSDCLDEDCNDVDGCEFATELTCDDQYDNDADGKADCADADCFGPDACEEEAPHCSDSEDNDADGLVDCLDDDCHGHDGCEHGTELTCNDGFDNDADDTIDCCDSNCSGTEYCLANSCPYLEDAFVNQFYPNENYGNDQELHVRGGSTNQREAMVRFDLPSIPPGSTITSATLHLYFAGEEWGDANGRTLNCYRVTETWDESTVTWNNRPSHLSTVTSTAVVPLYEQSGWMTWEVMADVQDFIDGVGNHGWKIKDEMQNDETPIIEFRSGNSGYGRPCLTITYE